MVDLTTSTIALYMQKIRNATSSTLSRVSFYFGFDFGFGWNHQQDSANRGEDQGTDKVPPEAETFFLTEKSDQQT